MKTQDEQKIMLVDSYLNGELSAGEKRDFEKQVQEDPDLAVLLEMQRDIREAATDRDALDFAGMLETAYDSYRGSRRKIRRHRTVYRIAGVAATLTLFLTVGLLLRQNNNGNPVNRAIVKEFYQPYEVPVNYRSAEGTVDGLFRKAVEKYNEKRYEEAISLFEKVLKKDNTRMDANLMNGLSNFEIEHYDRADSSFSRIIKHRDNLYFQQAQWYLGFCFLMTNQNEKAVSLYRKIVDEQGFYSGQAGKILKMLSSAGEGKEMKPTN